jgi:Cu-Zn family superoxide dismutase
MASSPISPGDGPHAGDLPNVLVAKNGSDRYQVLTDMIAVKSRCNGSALVTQTGVDGYTTDPSGNAGDRWLAA